MHPLSAWVPILIATLCQATDESPTLALPPSSAVPGGIVILDLETTSESPPRVLYGDHPVMVVRENDKWRALVGIPLATDPGRQVVRIGDTDPPRYQAFTVEAKQYATQRLKVAPAQVDLSKQD